MARHIDDDNDADVDAYEGDSDDGDAHDDDDGEVRAAAANSPSRASPPALSLANVTKVLMIIISIMITASMLSPTFNSQYAIPFTHTHY